MAKTTEMEVITRTYYAEKIDTWLGSEQIIVLTGQRRVGKSYVMKDFIARHEKEPDANIIYIDKEKRSFRFIQNSESLDSYVDAHLLPDKHKYIIIDADDRKPRQPSIVEIFPQRFIVVGEPVELQEFVVREALYLNLFVASCK